MLSPEASRLVALFDQVRCRSLGNAFCPARNATPTPVTISLFDAHVPSCRAQRRLHFRGCAVAASARGRSRREHGFGGDRGAAAILVHAVSCCDPELAAATRGEATPEATEAPNGVAAMAALVRYILAVTETDPKRTHEFFGQLGPKEELAFMTGAEMLTEEVRIEAEARGRAEGEARGEARGRADILLKQLALKFGPLSDAHIAQVQASSVEELELYAERVLTVDSLDAVLAE